MEAALVVLLRPMARLSCWRNASECDCAVPGDHIVTVCAVVSLQALLDGSGRVAESSGHVDGLQWDEDKVVVLQTESRAVTSPPNQLRSFRH